MSRKKKKYCNGNHAQVGLTTCHMCGRKYRPITKKCYFVPVVGAENLPTVLALGDWCLTHLLHKRRHAGPQD